MKPLSLKERLKLSRFFSGEQPTDEAITLNQRRVFILPSKAGLWFVVLIVLLFLIAFVYNNNITYLLTFLLASIFFITILHTYRSLAGLVIQEGQTRPVFAGEAAGFDIHISNPVDTPRPQFFITLQNTETVSMEPYSKLSVTLHSITQKRGWHTIGTVTLSSHYPLGLFRAWSPIRFSMKALVYPKPAALEIPFPETASADALQGLQKKGSEDFYGLQEYQAGDAIRHIHWKAYAKGLGLFSKQYGGESNLAQIWLDYEYTPGHNTEERISQLCRWVIDAERAGILYGFCVPGVRLMPDSGSAHYRKCLEALALM